MASFSDETWSIYEAIIEIFFSDSLEVQRDSGYKAKLVKGLTERSRSERSPTFFDLSVEDKARLEPIIEGLKKGGVELTEKYPPIYWVRYSRQVSLAIHLSCSSQFFRSFGEWRLKTEDKNGLMTLVAKNNPTEKLSKSNSRTMTLDQYILDPEISDDIEWDIKYLTTHSSKQKPTLKHRETRDIVGAHLYDAVQKCVEEAANGKVRILGFTGEKIGDRFGYRFRRRTLASKLLKKFSKRLSNRSVNAITQALSDFVACPGYSSKKLGKIP